MKKETNFMYSVSNPILMIDFRNGNEYLSYLGCIKYKILQLYDKAKISHSSRLLLDDIRYLIYEIEYLCCIVLPDQGRRNYPSLTQGGH